MTVTPQLSFWDTLGQNWDSGQTWDAFSVNSWLGLIPPENNQQPNYMTMLATILQPFSDSYTVATSLPGLFDLDTAVGSQLDVVGQWIGISRNVTTPLTGVYFSFDTAGLGWDQGVWQGPFDPSTGLVSLGDSDYRFLLYAKIAMNQWDGTIPYAQNVLNELFPGQTVIIQDSENNHMSFGMLVLPQNVVQAALFTQGYIQLVPAGVQVDGFYVPKIAGVPFFGFDAEDAAVSGFDVGQWAQS